MAKTVIIIPSSKAETILSYEQGMLIPIKRAL